LGPLWNSETGVSKDGDEHELSYPGDGEGASWIGARDVVRGIGLAPVVLTTWLQLVVRVRVRFSRLPRGVGRGGFDRLSGSGIGAIWPERREDSTPLYIAFFIEMFTLSSSSSERKMYCSIGFPSDWDMESAVRLGDGVLDGVPALPTPKGVQLVECELLRVASSLAEISVNPRRLDFFISTEL
jgi:hypothetical protein